MKTKQRKIKFLEQKEIEQIITGIKPVGERNIRDRALIEVLFSTGLRISECLNLPDAPFMKEQTETLELSICGKGGYDRTVYFSEKCLKAIQKYLEKRGINNDKLLLFDLTPRAVQIMVKKRGLAAGFEGVHPHLFRHSFACNMLKNGVNLYYIKEFCGHRSLNSTQQYLHATNKELLDMHKKIYGKE